MSKSINRVTLLGNVGKDPEIRSTGGGTLVASFSIATTERYKQGNDWKDRTDWHNVVVYGRLAEVVRDYVKKGAKLYVEGKLTTRSWDGNDGKRQYRTEVSVNELILLDGKRESASNYSPFTDAPSADDDPNVPF